MNMAYLLFLPIEAWIASYKPHFGDPTALDKRDFLG
jgi:hypothetical protein